MAFNLDMAIKKMADRDKDFRYMALNDLSKELEKESFKIDHDQEKKLCKAILKLLDDTSGDVQGLTVKCLGPLVTRFKESSIQEIVDALAGYVCQNKKEELRDIAGIGLKTVISSSSSSTASLVIKRVTPHLIKGINGEVAEVTLECLGVLNDLLKNFATLMNKDHSKIQKAILPQLTATRPATRKRAVNCLGYLSISTPEELFHDLVTYLLDGIKTSKRAKDIRTYISVIGAVSRSVGFRLGKYIESEGIIPLLVKYLSDERFEEDDELRENCFHTFESLVLRCPKEIRPFLDVIIEQSLNFIKHDPNYVDDDDEENEGDDEDMWSGDEGEEWSEEEEPEDDDDMSWKIRRASAKCISSIVSTRPDLLESLYKSVVPAIIARFREREENVRLDVYATFIGILKQTSLVSLAGSETESGPLVALNGNVNRVLTNLAKDLAGKSIKTRIGAFQVVRQMVLVSDGILGSDFGLLVAGFVDALALDKSTNVALKNEALTTLELVLSRHPPETFHPHVKELIAPVFKSVEDSYYKITQDALSVLTELVKVVRPSQDSSFEYQSYAKPMYDSVFPSFSADSIESEVKNRAIHCMGLIISRLGDDLSADDVKAALDILLERLRNEITRLNAVSCLEVIACAYSPVDVSSILEPAIEELSALLRQKQPQIKQASLKTLHTLVSRLGESVPRKQYTAVLREVNNLIGADDLHMSHLSLRLVEAVLVADKKSISTMRDTIYPTVQTLVKSSLLQGLALESLLSLYSCLVSLNAKKFGFHELLDSLLASGRDSLKSSTSTAASHRTVAQCVAALCVNATDDQKSETVSRFVADVKKAKRDSSRVRALLCLGEIGRRIDLSGQKDLQKVILGAFSGTEDVKVAAAFCLGNVCVGNIKAFLPSVLKEISKDSDGSKYLLLSSLKEIIARSSSSPSRVEKLEPHFPQVLDILFANTENAEEGSRNVVAECMGKIAIINHEEMIPALRKHISAESALSRATTVTALKFAITEQPQAVDKELSTAMGEFLHLIQDENLDVRRSALLTLNYAAHNKPVLIRSVLNKPVHEDRTPLDLVYEATVFTRVRVVDLGPFKHKVDDGLEIRKAAFECMYTMLDTCLDKLDLPLFISKLVPGLADNYDIKLLVSLMLVRLARSAGPSLAQGLDELVEPLKKIVLHKVNEGSVKHEADRNEELIRASLRAIAAISRIPDVESTSVRFDEFMKTTVRAGSLAENYQLVLKEGSSK